MLADCYYVYPCIYNYAKVLLKKRDSCGASNSCRKKEVYSVMTKGLSVIRSFSQASCSFIYGQSGAKARWVLGTCIPIIKTQKGASAVLPYMYTMLKANCREVSQSEIYAVTGIFYVLLLTYHCVRTPIYDHAP